MPGILAHRHTLHLHIYEHTHTLRNVPQAPLAHVSFESRIFSTDTRGSNPRLSWRIIMDSLRGKAKILPQLVCSWHIYIRLKPRGLCSDRAKQHNTKAETGKDRRGEKEKGETSLGLAFITRLFWYEISSGGFTWEWITKQSSMWEFNYSWGRFFLKIYELNTDWSH